MKKMLIVSRYCASDAAGYAGSKTHNYYLKKFRGDFDLKVVTVADPAEAPKLDFANYGIDADVAFIEVHPRRLLLYLAYNWWNIPNYFGKTYGVDNGYVQHVVFKKLKTLKRLRYSPDIVLLEWTQTSLMVRRIKKLFPRALYIASEHDVAFIKTGRLIKTARGLARIRELLRHNALKKAELASLAASHVVITQSEKDRTVLAANNIPAEKIHVIAPYFTDYGDVRYSPRGTTLFFFGAMDRFENYGSILWFVEHVFTPLLQERYSLCVVGGNPHPSLRNLASDRIEIAGFVPDIRPYLRKSLCMIAPLVSGAGIKVKVIEAMSAGLPVITNAIGIEGIAALDGVHYLHCETPHEYAAVLGKIRDNTIDLTAISANVKKLVADSFNLEKSYASYRKFIMEKADAPHP